MGKASQKRRAHRKREATRIIAEAGPGIYRVKVFRDGHAMLTDDPVGYSERCEVIEVYAPTNREALEVASNRVAF